MKRKIYCTFTVIIAALSVVCLYGLVESNNYKNVVRANYRRCYSELVNYVTDIDTTLSKAVITNDHKQMSLLSEKLWLYSAFAKENLGMLPLSSSELDKTQNFLAQVGDYSYSLAKQLNEGKELTDDQYTQLASLVNYSETLSTQLLAMEEGIMNGEIPVELAEGRINNISVFNENFEEIEEKFSDYTSLVYDGPFSEHNEKNTGDLLNSQVITKEDARTAVKNLLGNKIKMIRFEGESQGSIPSYNFSVTTNTRDRSIYVQISKNGGYPVLMLDNKEILEQKIEYSEAEKNAQMFLIDNNFVKMKQTGYVISGNTITFAYAFLQNEFVMYPDLIKVKVALDNGEIIGLETNGFLSNHKESRTIPELSITKEEASKLVSPVFQLQKINKALIPLDTGKEVYCYELLGKVNNKLFLIYINTETGIQEDIKMVVQTTH
ncbi:MAG: germination protein YpeB, partial [Clostridia bacterium]|nr:germination protein YpeB [Clostridia bacterium]